MSLARTALRLGAVAALQADPTIAALCPRRVFESRIDDLDAEDPVPVIVVFTEDDKGHAWSANNGGPPFDHACELLIELSMRVIVPATDTDPVMIGTAETDSEAEAALDLLEEVVIIAVSTASTPQAQLLRDGVVRRYTEFKSIRYAAADAGSKLAVRILSLTAHLKIEEPDAWNVPTSPFAALPDPLRTVALSLSPTSAGHATCSAIAAMFKAPTPSLPQAATIVIEPNDYRVRRCPEPGDWTAPDQIIEDIDFAPDEPVAYIEMPMESDPCPTDPCASS